MERFVIDQIKSIGRDAEYTDELPAHGRNVIKRKVINLPSKFEGADLAGCWINIP